MSWKKEWLTFLDVFLNKLKGENETRKDRLDHMAFLNHNFICLSTSLKNWLPWFEYGNAKTYTLEDTQEMADVFYEATKQIVELDKKMVKKYGREAKTAKNVDAKVRSKYLV